MRDLPGEVVGSVLHCGQWLRELRFLSKGLAPCSPQPDPQAHLPLGRGQTTCRAVAHTPFPGTWLGSFRLVHGRLGLTQGCVSRRPLSLLMSTEESM